MLMRIVIGAYLALALSPAMAQPAAKPEAGAKRRQNECHYDGKRGSSVQLWTFLERLARSVNSERGKDGDTS